jgi:phage terminase large subunit-like protein
VSALPKVRPIGKLERLGLEREERDLRTAGQRGLVFDHDEADRAVRFFATYCRHHKGEWAGKPLVLSDWQDRNIRQIFGWRRVETGFRRFRSAWWETPRKNGKTQVAAGVGIKLLIQDSEPGGEVYFTATKRDQALIGHVAAAEMVRASPELRKWIEVPKSFKRGGTMFCDRLGSKMEPLSSDHNTLDGLGPHGDIRDEVHAWPDHGLADVLDTAMGSRRQPITLEITTAGTYSKEGVGWQHHDYATKVLDGTFEDDTIFAYIAAADEGDDPFDPATWWKANPGLGISLKLDYIAKQAARAKREPSFLNTFLRLHLNVWTQQVTRWLSTDRWRECDGKPIDLAALAGRPCWGGLDLSTKLDLTAFVLVFIGEDGWLTIVPRFWIPEATVEAAAKRGRHFYTEWVRDGWLKTTPGDVIDYGFIRKEIVELGKQFQIREIAFDPWNATQIATELGEQDGFTVVDTRQGFKTLSEPSKEFEARIMARQVHTGGNPVMDWMVGNAVVRSDPNGNIAPDKAKASDKIDGVVATIMALSRANVQGGDAPAASYLETEPLLLL